MLDIRLAVNPWIPLQARYQLGSQSRSSTSQGQPHPVNAASFRTSLRTAAYQDQPGGAASTAHSYGQPGRLLLGAPRQHVQVGSAAGVPMMQQGQPHDTGHVKLLASMQGLFRLDPQRLEGNIDYAAAGGPLTAAELRDAVVISHSLPGARLAEVLADVRRFLTEQPTEVGSQLDHASATSSCTQRVYIHSL